MTDDARVIAHAMLTQALVGDELDRPALVGADLGTACIWLRNRAAKVLSDALEPRALLDAVAAELQVEHPDPVGAGRSGLDWPYQAVIEMAAAELEGDGARVDHATVRNLTRDPDAMLGALAELTAALYRAHDGNGATAVVRALRP